MSRASASSEELRFFSGDPAVVKARWSSTLDSKLSQTADFNADMRSQF
jgi:hypothetical protein